MSKSPTVVLTGASGVLGSALLPELADCHVIALTHGRPVPAADEQMACDLTAPGLGLGRAARRRLAAGVDAVVHCAAATGFATGPDRAFALNVAGTRRVARLAAETGAALYHVSTAFVARTGLARLRTGPPRARTAHPADYLNSKRAAENEVRASGAAATIVRPSVLIGDSVTGAITAFQGLHAMLHGLLRGLVPMLPLARGSLVDFVPQDVAASAIAALVRAGRCGGEMWITAGERALTVEDALHVLTDTAEDLGIPVALPRLIDPDAVERLIRPVFLRHLRPGDRRQFEAMLALTCLFSGASDFPTSLGATLGGPTAPTVPDLRAALRTSIVHLARAKGLAPTAARLSEGVR
ncbi:SDR family oxidoreductase [Streptomyces sp. NPDC007808]|uniref:SDR family oxidoreductase n=1 Tax=Streptomyces sp. NPDC007808 TaxID=3364779 RepID=UPI0036B97350